MAHGKPSNLKPVNGEKSLKIKPANGTELKAFRAKLLEKFKNKINNKLNQTDTYEWYVAYSATYYSAPDTYYVQAGVLLYDETTNTYNTEVPVPANLTVYITSGMFAGYNFTIPEGDIAVYLGEVNSTSGVFPDLTAYTNPTVLGGYTVIQALPNINNHK